MDSYGNKKIYIIVLETNIKLDVMLYKNGNSNLKIEKQNSESAYAPSKATETLLALKQHSKGLKYCLRSILLSFEDLSKFVDILILIFVKIDF